MHGNYSREAHGDHVNINGDFCAALPCDGSRSFLGTFFFSPVKEVEYPTSPPPLPPARSVPLTPRFG